MSYAGFQDTTRKTGSTLPNVSSLVAVSEMSRSLVRAMTGVSTLETGRFRSTSMIVMVVILLRRVIIMIDRSWVFWKMRPLVMRGGSEVLRTGGEILTILVVLVNTCGT